MHVHSKHIILRVRALHTRTAASLSPEIRTFTTIGLANGQVPTRMNPRSDKCFLFCVFLVANANVEVRHFWLSNTIVFSDRGTTTTTITIFKCSVLRLCFARYTKHRGARSLRKGDQKCGARYDAVAHPQRTPQQPKRNPVTSTLMFGRRSTGDRVATKSGDVGIRKLKDAVAPWLSRVGSED